MKGIFRTIGKLFLYITLIGSIILDVQIVWHEWAYPGILLSFGVFPLAFLGIPIFAVFKYGRWLPILFTYGGGLITIVLLSLGGEFDEN